MHTAWSSNWAWGLPLTACTLVLHVAAVVTLAFGLTRAARVAEARRLSPSLTAVLSTLVIGAVGWALAALYGIQAAIWAVAYLLLGAVPVVADAMLYSLNSITGLGDSGLQLQPHWRLLGAVEAANGALLTGISTAFLFAVLSEVWRLISRLWVLRHRDDLK
jgi:hypothetical protein